METINTFIYSRSFLENQNRFQTKMGKAYTRFQTKTAMGRHIRCNLYKGVPPPPAPGHRPLYKIIQDSHGFWISSCGFRIPGTGFRTPCQCNLDSACKRYRYSEFLELSIADLRVLDSSFHKKRVPDSEILNYLLHGATYDFETGKVQQKYQRL